MNGWLKKYWNSFHLEHGNPDTVCRLSVSYRKPLVLAAPWFVRPSKPWKRVVYSSPQLAVGSRSGALTSIWCRAPCKPTCNFLTRLISRSVLTRYGGGSEGEWA